VADTFAWMELTEAGPAGIWSALWQILTLDWRMTGCPFTVTRVAGAVH
jgi:hypothetical protein